MKTGRSTEYGLIGVSFIAKNDEGGPVMAQKIAERYAIPLEYLLKILQQMVRAGILRSKRGPRGGFNLAKSLKKITLAEVIEAIEGPMVIPMHLAEQAKNEPFSTKVEKVCHDLAEKTRDNYNKVKLSDILI